MDVTRFCECCQNMMFLVIDESECQKDREEDYFVYHCRVCGKQVPINEYLEKTTNKNFNFFTDTYVDSNLIDSELQQSLKYISHDPTIPIVDHVDCPNQCKDNRMLYVQLSEGHHSSKVRYYVCSTCKNIIKNTS
jgi:DNA-directed RNA polymerase subunit M/transcription elongation factor TFIIS